MIAAARELPAEPVRARLHVQIAHAYMHFVSCILSIGLIYSSHVCCLIGWVGKPERIFGQNIQMFSECHFGVGKLNEDEQNNEFGFHAFQKFPEPTLLTWLHGELGLLGDYEDNSLSVKFKICEIPVKLLKEPTYE